MEAAQKVTLIKQLIQENYTPAPDLASADLKLTTNELLRKFHESIPGNGLDSETVFDLMHTLGFQLADYTEMNFVWLITEKR